jgi:hypothetical protein
MNMNKTYVVLSGTMSLLVILLILPHFANAGVVLGGVKVKSSTKTQGDFNIAASGTSISIGSHGVRIHTPNVDISIRSVSGGGINIPQVDVTTTASHIR